MSKENNLSAQEILAKLQQAQALLDECVAALDGQPVRKSKRAPKAPRSLHSTPHLDFDANERAFMRAHAINMSGGRRFALVLAYLARGDAKKEIQLRDIERLWKRMTARLGDFNRKYSNDAKENGWVDTKKKGVYFLPPSWQGIFK